jgi:hypothetical protein
MMHGSVLVLWWLLTIAVVPVLRSGSPPSSATPLPYSGGGDWILCGNVTVLARSTMRSIAAVAASSSRKTEWIADPG